MNDDWTDVLAAGCQHVGAATAGFDALMQIVRDGPVAIEDTILVTHDEDGEVTVPAPLMPAAPITASARRRR